MKEDKHLLGEDRFFKGGKKVNTVVLPFSTIDLVFNHKNIWANLQNSDPTKIYYHLHNESLWLPFVTDMELLHPLELRDRLREIERKKRFEMQEQGIEKNKEEEEEQQKKKKEVETKKSKETNLMEFKMKGDDMKPFTPFYDPRALDPPLTQMQVTKLENNILKEIEIVIRQVRSYKNLNTKFQKSKASDRILRQYNEFLEDDNCERILAKERKKAKEFITKETVKLIPPAHKIEMLPSFFNYTDTERIRTVLQDRT